MNLQLLEERLEHAQHQWGAGHRNEAQLFDRDTIQQYYAEMPDDDPGELNRPRLAEAHRTSAGALVQLLIALTKRSCRILRRSTARCSSGAKSNTTLPILPVKANGALALYVGETTSPLSLPMSMPA
jgi:hypothetical protein